MAKVKLSTHFPVQITFEGQKIAGGVARLDVAEFIEFEKQFLTYSRPMAGNPDGAEIIKHAETMLAWAGASFAAYVRVDPGELEDKNGKDVVDGAHFYQVLGGQIETMMETLALVWTQNRVPEGQRKNLQSLSGSATSSDALDLEAVGPKPEPTAASAESSPSAPIVDALPAETPILSGATTAAAS